VELLADEFLARRKRGERPTIREYCDRHPELAEEIRDVFEAVLLVEDLKPGSSDASGPGGDSDRVAGQRLRQVGDYRILAEIGRGGMGIVYEAEQQALGRRVALKVLLRAAAGDGQAQARFQREAKAAARLHHTNIVPVFDVGQDGEHLFYAMQLIHGQGLDSVLDDLRRLPGQPQAGPPAQDKGIAASLLSGRFEQELLAEGGDADATAAFESRPPSSAVLPGNSELSAAASDRRGYYRGVAQIGVQVAGALGYAHARGIVHRDIKPANLLLDTTGNVWVTDFGLAKTGEGELTHTGDVLGTLRYMAPERFRGQCDVRADVYALGLTLYELLALRPAFASGDRLELIGRIRAAEPARPRSVDRRVPRDLETVVLKAMDKDPKRRYQSAEELLEDLQRFARDEPIQARRAGPAERLGRWCRRNPAVAVLTAAVLLLMAVGTAVSARQAVLATRAREDLAAKNRELADEQAKVQARFELAQRAIALFHTGVSEDALLKNAEFQELRTKLLKQAADFYADLEKLLKGQADAKSRKALAAAYFQLGELTNKIGDKKEALAVHRKALALRRELAAAEGADVETRLDVGRSLQKVGRLLAVTGDTTGALAALEEQRELAERLQAEHPTDAVRSVLAQAHLYTGVVLSDAGKSAEALPAYHKALPIQQQLADANPAVPEFQRDLADLHNTIGIDLQMTGKPEEALTAWRKALAIQQKLADANPAVTDFQHQLGMIHHNIGMLLSLTGRWEEAMPWFLKALAIGQKIADANPAVAQYQNGLAVSHAALGATLSRTAKLEQAAEAYSKALAVFQKLANANPTVPYYQRSLATLHNELGRILARQKRFAEAFPALEAGLAIRRELVKADPKHPLHTNHLGYSHAFRGCALVWSNQRSKAAGDLRRALELWAQGPAPDPETPFERARARALLAGLAGEAQSGVTKEEAAAFADQAVASLREAINAGYLFAGELKEPDFDPLRGRDDFRKLQA
jgi:serine/threonine-protein kinase